MGTLVDRLEELLARMEDEDEDEEESRREDGPALSPRAAPAAASPEDDGEAAPAGDGGQGDAPADGGGRGPDRTAGEPAADGPEPAWPLESPVMAAQGAQYRALRERLEEAEEGLRVVKASGAQAEGGPAAAVKGGGGTGLEGLYRQTVRASRPAPQALPIEQAGRTIRAEEPGRTAALTVDELDRAVRRDSRRYDGGMTLF